MSPRYRRYGTYGLGCTYPKAQRAACSPGGIISLPVGTGADTKIELGFSMTLRQATPGTRPEGRRFGTLRLGRRLDRQKIGLNPCAKA